MAKSRAKPKATLTIQIQEDSWTLKLWRKKSYDRKFGEDSDGITFASDKEINFREDAFTLDLVSHELFHAYFKYLHLDSVTSPTVDGLEEIMASWIGLNLDKFHEKVHYSFNALIAAQENNS